MSCLFAVVSALCLCAVRDASASDFFSSDQFSDFVFNPARNVCEVAPAGRVPWIIHVRASDYGWNVHTHRANIALAVNAYRGTAEEERKMALQLELEITKALFRNETLRIHENDLALFIHALIARCKNPRDFHGADLVADLLHRVETAIVTRESVHPFLVLALCNSGVVSLRHLESIAKFTHHDHTTFDLDGRDAELKALALKAYACAADLNRNLAKFPTEMKTAAECLTRRQNQMRDGSFGNVYTTALAVQALTACRREECRSWDKIRAREVLLRESVINVNMIKAYYIEMALNAQNVTYLKDLCNINMTGPDDRPPPVDQFYVQYTIKEAARPSFYFTVSLLVEPRTTFFQVMEKASELSDRFGFNYTLNHQRLPMVHGVSGTPNDAEENKFWRICHQTAGHNNLHTSRVTDFRDSPQLLLPSKGDHVVLWYRNTQCPLRSIDL